MEQGHTNRADGRLLLALGVLGILIVGLIVTLVVLMQIKSIEKKDDIFADNIQVGAEVVSTEIQEKVYNDGSLDMQLADELYEQAIAKYKGDNKLAVVIKYASFVYNNEVNALRAIEILNKYESYVTVGAMSGQYYALMASLYAVTGDDALETFYNQKSNEVWPENPSKIENNVPPGERSEV